MRPLPTDTAASYRAAVNAFRDDRWTAEERAHLARLEDAERARPIHAAPVKRAA